MRSVLAFQCVLLLPVIAQDGAQLYTQYCSACHAPDGTGATGGQFPPLAGSAWLEGEPDRAIKAVLHGLEGPVEVKGRTYDLLMPPQGAVLSDDSLAAILTHVRSSWGNQAPRVEPAAVKAIRSSTGDRENPWTARELLKDHPLPKPPSPLKNLITKVYKGKWDKFPDFNSLEPEAVEEEQEGIISLKKINHEDDFGVVWEGDFLAPRGGNFIFGLDADDEARLIIGGKEVVKIAGAGPVGRTQKGRIPLKKGPVSFRLEYREVQGLQDISLWFKTAGTEQTWLSAPKASKKGQDNTWSSIPIRPTPDRAAIYRNFIAGTTPRAIGIGFPSSFNLAYSADHLAPELIWRGDFMDGGRHWTNRGQGAEPPAGKDSLKLTASRIVPEDIAFGGYRLDPVGNPTFILKTPTGTIRDSYRSSQSGLLRELGSTTSAHTTLLLSEKNPIEADGDNAWIIDGRVRIAITGDAQIALQGDRLSLTLAKGSVANLTYSWK